MFGVPVIVFVFIFPWQLDARAFQVARRTVSCGLIGANSMFLRDVNGIYCCNTFADDQPSSTFVVCDLNNHKIAGGFCPEGDSCGLISLIVQTIYTIKAYRLAVQSLEASVMTLNVSAGALMLQRLAMNLIG